MTVSLQGGRRRRRPKLVPSGARRGARRLTAATLALLTAVGGSIVLAPSSTAVPPPVTAAADPVADAAALDWANYELVTLADQIADAIDLAILPDGRVLSTVRTGGIRLTDPDAGTTQLVNQFDVYTTGEMGMQTITLDPNFAENQWVYLFYAPTQMKAPYPQTTPGGNAPGTLPAGQTDAYWDLWKGYSVLSRFEWDAAANSLDISSEQEIIRIDTNRGQCCHQGGDVAFDADGNLYLSTGDNTGSGAGGAGGFTPINDLPGNNPGFDARRGSGNTNDLRGKIVKIKVLDEIAAGATPGVGTTYTIPTGNLFPEDGPNADKTRPEIYVMGLRNPFRIEVDRESGTLMWGDYGPDAGRADPKRGPMGYVEWNAIATEGAAHNSGWPFCVGDNTEPYNDWNWATNTSGAWFDCANLKNDSRYNTGLVDLPAAVPADLWYGDRNCRTPEEGCDQPWPELQSFSENIEQAPMAGPIYRYDAASTSETKLPEYWNGKAFFGEYSQDYLAAFTFDAPEGAVTKIENVFPNGDLGAVGYPLWDGVIDLEFGDDGSLYVLNYISQKLVRMDYSPDNKRPRPAVVATPSSGPGAPMTVQFDASGSTDPDGDALTYSWDFQSDGTQDATGPIVSYTYTALGQYRAQLTVTDSNGKSTVASTSVSVGNTAPTVQILGLPDGGFIEFGKAAIYQVGVADPDESGPPICANTRYTMALGHASHAHPFTTGRGCKIGVPTFPNAYEDHGPTEDLYSVLAVQYTDSGANGVPAATSTAQVILNPMTLEAEYAERQQGTTNTDNAAASATRVASSIEPSDWLAFEPVNFSGITGLGAVVDGAGSLALRWDDPAAAPFATVTVPTGTGLREVALTGVTLPTGSGTLYVTGETGDVSLDALKVTGSGVGDVTTPTVTGVWNPATPTGENGWYKTNPTLTLTPVDNGSIYSREYSVDGGTTWQQISYADQYGSLRELGNTLVFTDPGESTVMFRVRDTSQNISQPGTLTVKIDTIKPTIDIAGIQNGTALGDITVAVSDAEPGSGGARITSVTLDEQPVAAGAAQRNADPQLTINAAALQKGTSYTLVVKAKDLAGNEQIRTETFVAGDIVKPTATAALSPTPATGNNSWYLEAPTLVITAGDNVAVAQRQYSLDAGVTWLDADADGRALITKEGVTAVQFRAIDSSGNISTVGSITVNLDTRLPTITFPQIVGGVVANTGTLVPTIGDQLPGSGDGSRDLLNSSAIHKMTLDGVEIPIEPINLSTLSSGLHTVTVVVHDPAGNAAKYTQTFVVAAAGEQPNADGTGLTSERLPTPRALPNVTVNRSVPNPNADFDTLIVARTQGFRHTHIPDAIVKIQELGVQNNFNVDLWDPTLPNASLAENPLLSLEKLQQYETVIFNSTTGNANFSAAEEDVIEAYIKGGGGYVGIHAATDCCRQWQWYRDLAGAVFIGHPQGPLGQNPPCETCFDATVVTEETLHPAMSQFPTRWATNDEWYNLDHNVRGEVHVLQSLDESTLRNNLNIIRTGRFANGFNTLMGDHPLSWCQNYDGGRAFTQVAGHNRALWYDPAYLNSIKYGILTTAGEVDANCSSYREADRLIGSLAESGGVAADAAASIDAGFVAARDAYLAKKPAVSVTELQKVAALVAALPAGDARTRLADLTADLTEWMDSLLSESTTKATVASSTVTFGNPGSVTVTVTGGSAAAGGTVTLTVAGQPVGSGTVVNGAATVTLTKALPVGAHTVTATFVSDGADRSSSGTGRLNVVKSGSVVTASVSPNPVKPSVAAKVSVHAESTTGVAGTGTVTVLVKRGVSTAAAVTAAVDADGNAVITLPKLTAGSYTLTVTHAATANTHAAATTTTLTVRA